MDARCHARPRHLLRMASRRRTNGGCSKRGSSGQWTRMRACRPGSSTRQSEPSRGKQSHARNKLGLRDKQRGGSGDRQRWGEQGERVQVMEDVNSDCERNEIVGLNNLQLAASQKSLARNISIFFCSLSNVTGFQQCAYAAVVTFILWPTNSLLYSLLNKSFPLLPAVKFSACTPAFSSVPNAAVALLSSFPPLPGPSYPSLSSCACLAALLARP